jgi:hypothetical protein
MDTFDLKQYLAEGRLFKEEIGENDLDIASELKIYFEENPFNEENQYGIDTIAKEYIQNKINRPLTPKEKSTITRISHKYRDAYWNEEFTNRRTSEAAAARKRYQSNLLPLMVSNGSGKPDSKYYQLANTYYDTDRDGNVYISHSDPKSGYTDYRLRDEWVDTPVEDSVLNKFWSEKTLRYFNIERK